MNTINAMNTILNSIRISVSDVRQVDLDGRPYGFRASKSYWIDEGWDSERWKNYQLPQIAIFELEGSTIAEGRKSYNERYENVIYQINVFASGRNQMNDLASQIKDGFYNWNRRKSMAKSGLKLDRKISDFDTIDDEMLPQQVFRKQISWRVLYQASGS